MRTLAVVVLVLISACSTLSPEEQERREYLQRDFEARFLDFQQSCLAAGGTVFVDSLKPMTLRGLPRRGAFYSCHR